MTSNRRTGRGEIDLLVRIDGRVVAVEVKTRVGADPLTQVTRVKSERMRRATRAVGASRTDVVTVQFDGSGATIRWLRGI